MLIAQYAKKMPPLRHFDAAGARGAFFLQPEASAGQLEAFGVGQARIGVLHGGGEGGEGDLLSGGHCLAPWSVVGGPLARPTKEYIG